MVSPGTTTTGQARYRSTLHCKQNYLSTHTKKINPELSFLMVATILFPLVVQPGEMGRFAAPPYVLCNLNRYLQTDWYINQMKREAYDSPAGTYQWSRYRICTGAVVKE